MYLKSNTSIVIVNSTLAVDRSGWKSSLPFLPLVVTLKSQLQNQLFKAKHSITPLQSIRQDDAGHKKKDSRHCRSSEATRASSITEVEVRVLVYWLEYWGVHVYKLLIKLVSKKSCF